MMYLLPVAHGSAPAGQPSTAQPEPWRPVLIGILAARIRARPEKTNPASIARSGN